MLFHFVLKGFELRLKRTKNLFKTKWRFVLNRIMVNKCLIKSFWKSFYTKIVC